MPRRPGTLARLWRDRRGAVLIYVTLTVGVMFGLGGLAIDGARLYGVHTEMQSFADHVALAAAGELDGNGGAMERAELAAALVVDTQTFATGGPDELVIEEIRFFSQIPGDDVAGRCGRIPDGEGVPATSDQDARFVEVTVRDEEVGLSLLRGLTVLTGNELDDPTTCTSATAGFVQYVCNFPPLMICNPYEDPINGGGGFEPIIGQQILAKAKGQGTSDDPGSQWAPGDFGLLQAVESAGVPHCTGGGAQRIRCVMALVEPNTQCVGGTVDIMPGQAVSVHDGLNVRFDIWNSPLSPASHFLPSVNVTKGARWTGTNDRQCQFPQNFDQDQAQLMRLPRDTCLADSSCARFGNAEWDRGGYWATNHPGLPQPIGYAEMTRFDVYRYEIDNGWIPDAWDLGGERGSPQCAAAGIDNPLRDRRVLIGAVINCREHGIRGRTDDVPVIAFAEMFLTEPVGMDGASTDDIWIEMIGVVEPGADDGVLHDYIQLYR
jgi:hypothetical protein